MIKRDFSRCRAHTGAEEVAEGAPFGEDGVGADGAVGEGNEEKGEEDDDEQPAVDFFHGDDEGAELRHAVEIGGECGSAEEEGHEQGLFFHAVVNHEVEACEIYGGKCEADGGHGLVAPFASREGEVGERAADDDACKYIPVEVNEVDIVKSENGGGVSVFEDVFRCQEGEEDEVDTRGAGDAQSRC